MRLLIAIALFALVSPLLADDFKPEPGFELMFNGKDLTGWKTLGTKNKAGESLEGKSEAWNGRFKVKNGELVIDPSVKGDVRIETVKEYAKDVAIKFEFFPDAKCNNDLFFRGEKFDLSKDNVKNIKTGEWNPVEITVKDGKTEFKVNGDVLRSAKTKNENSTFGIRAEFGAIQIRRLRVKEGG
jgi:hypothetical protein